MELAVEMDEGEVLSLLVCELSYVNPPVWAPSRIACRNGFCSGSTTSTVRHGTAPVSDDEVAPMKC
jgi:hypothetical protein